MLQKAVEIDPNNAFYWEQMGKYYLEVKKYREALLPLKRTINLREQQKEAQRIWASNKAKQHLSKLLIRADNEHDITSADFLGLNMEERESIVEFALKHNENHRGLHHVAAKFYYANRNFKKADSAMRKSLGDYKSYVSRSNIPKLEFFVNILKDGGHDPQALADVQAILRERGAKVP
ncbi:tetratricopeptide repeat protein [Thermodesulfobacteriota bacterium]